MTTKIDARVAKLAWNQAIADGRVAKFLWLENNHPQIRFQSFLTVREAKEAVERAIACGETANIVDPSLAR